MAESYQYRDNYWSRKVPAEVVAVELAKLRDSGDVTAARVVTASEPENAALHPAFEWDNSIAGHEYRLIQARRLIRAIVIVPETAEGEQKAAQSMFVHVPERDQSEGKYVPLSVVSESIDEYERALTEAQRFLDAAERRFLELRRLAEVKGGKTEALAIAIQGFNTVREAIELLR